MSGVQPLGIHHVAVNVRDVDEALGFYVEALGFTVRPDRPDFGFPGAWLDTGGAQQLHLVEREPGELAGEHFAVLVGDLDVTVAELRGTGHKVSDPQPVGHSRQAFVSDPSGNVVELHESHQSD